MAAGTPVSLRGEAVVELGRLVAELTAAGDFVGARVAAMALAGLADDSATAPSSRDGAEVIDLAVRRSR